MSRPLTLVTIGPSDPGSTIVSPYLNRPFVSNTSIVVPRPWITFTWCNMTQQVTHSMTQQVTHNMTQQITCNSWTLRFDARLVAQHKSMTCAPTTHTHTHTHYFVTQTAGIARHSVWPRYSLLIQCIAVSQNIEASWRVSTGTGWQCTPWGCPFRRLCGRRLGSWRSRSSGLCFHWTASRLAIAQRTVESGKTTLNFRIKFCCWWKPRHGFVLSQTTTRPSYKCYLGCTPQDNVGKISTEHSDAFLNIAFKLISLQQGFPQETSWILKIGGVQLVVSTLNTPPTSLGLSVALHQWRLSTGCCFYVHCNDDWRAYSKRFQTHNNILSVTTEAHYVPSSILKVVVDFSVSYRGGRGRPQIIAVSGLIRSRTKVRSFTKLRNLTF